MSVVVARQLVKTYVSGDIKVAAIRGVDFDIEPASLVAFVDRAKDPNNPEEALEDYVAAGVELIKSSPERCRPSP